MLNVSELHTCALKVTLNLGGLSCLTKLWSFSGSPGAPVRTGTLLVVPGGPPAQGENSPVMTGQRDTHEGERDMMDSHTGGRRERR